MCPRLSCLVSSPSSSSSSSLLKCCPGLHSDLSWHISQCIMEQSVDTPFPQAMERTVESEYLEPGPSAARWRRTGKSAPGAVCAAPATIKEDTYALSAPVTEYASSSSAPSRVSVCGAPAFADTYASPVPVTEYASSLSPAMANAGPTEVQHMLTPTHHQLQ